MTNNKNILIEGKKGKGGGSARSAQESDNTISSRTIVRILELISEGECVGLATGDAKSILFDDTPVQNADGSYNFKNVEYAVRTGLPSQPYMEGFPSAEAVTSIDTVLTKSSPVVVQVSDSDIDAVRVTIRLTAGLWTQNLTNGDKTGTTVEYAFDVRLDSIGTWSQVASKKVKDKSNDPFELDYRIERPAGNGLWSWRVRRITADSEASNVGNATAVSRYTEIKDVKLEYPYTAYVGIKVDAESTGNSVPTRAYIWDGIKCQVPTNYDPVTRQYSGQWNGTFKRAWTDNPAWILYDLLTNERYGMGEVFRSQIIDKFSFYEASVYNDQYVPTGKVQFPAGATIRQSDGAVLDANGVLIHTPEEKVTEPRYTFNAVLAAQEDALKVLQTLASTMRAVLIYSEGLIWISQDRPSDPVMLVTNANVIDGKFSYANSPIQQRHTVARVTWNNKNNKYLPDVATYEHPSSLLPNNYYPTDITALGCTTEGQAIRAGKWLIETEQTVKEAVGYQCSFDQFHVRINDVIQVWDKFITREEGAGRIVSASGQKVVLDRAITVQENAKLTVTLSNGAMQELPIVEKNGSYSTVTVVGSWQMLPLPANATFFLTDAIQPRLFRVTEIKRNVNTCDITALEYDPNKYARIEQGIVIAPPVYQNIKDTIILPVTDILATPESYVDPILGAQLNLDVTWKPPVDVLVAGYEIKWRFNGSSYKSEYSNKPSFVINGAAAGEYDILITAVSIDGKRSPTASYEYTQGFEGQNNLLPPTAITVVAGHGSGSAFTGNHLFVEWAANPTNQLIPNQSVGGYQVDVYNSATGDLLRTETTAYNETTYNYTADKMAKDGGAVRSIRITVWTLDATLRKSSASVSATFSNAAPAIPNNIAVQALTDGLMVRFDKPTEPDFAGTLIWLSDVSGFTPSASTLVFDGDSSLVTLPKLTAKPYYVRVAAYDTFGKSDTGAGLNLSSQFTATPLSAGITNVSELPATAAEDTVVYLATDKKLYVRKSGVWVAVVGDILTNSVTAVHLDSINAVITGTAQLGTAVVTTAAIEDAAITNAKISSISADKIETGTLGVGTIITVGSGVEISSDGAITSQTATRKTIMSDGNVISYKKIGGTFYPYRSLDHVETGTATNGTAVTIPGYFENQPRVQVSPANLTLYRAAYSSQDQAVNFSAGAISETSEGSMQWQFTPTALLNLGASSGTTSINATSGNITTANWTSATYTTQENCVSISPSLTMLTYRGNGSGLYIYRSARWRVEYYNASAWVTTDAFRTVNMGAQTSSAVSDTKTFTFPSAAAWQWRLYVEFFDQNTNTFGTTTYNYSTETLTLAAKTVQHYTSDQTSQTIVSDMTGPSLPSSVVNPTWEIYQIDYSIKANFKQWNSTYASHNRAFNVNAMYGLSSWGWIVTPSGTGPIMQYNSSGTQSASGAVQGIGSAGATASNTLTMTYTKTGSNLTLPTSINARSTVTYAYDYITNQVNYLGTSTVVVKRRQLVTPSTTATNNATVVDYDYELATAQVLATGTVNWIAVGS